MAETGTFLAKLLALRLAFAPFGAAGINTFTFLLCLLALGITVLCLIYSQRTHDNTPATSSETNPEGMHRPAWERTNRVAIVVVVLALVGLIGISIDPNPSAKIRRERERLAGFFASSDSTPEPAVEYRKDCPTIPLLLLSQPIDIYAFGPLALLSCAKSTCTSLHTTPVGGPFAFFLDAVVKDGEACWLKVRIDETLLSGLPVEISKQISTAYVNAGDLRITPISAEERLRRAEQLQKFRRESEK